MRRYELMLLFRPDLEDDKLQSAVEKVTRAVVNAGGTLTKVSPWGKRRLAYEIQHFREASYFLLHFDIAPSQIRDIERGLLISEEILRHLVVVLEDRGEMSEEDLPAAVPAARREDEDGEAGEEAVPTAEATDAPSSESADPVEDQVETSEDAAEATDGVGDERAADEVAADETAQDETAPEETAEEEPAATVEA
jgi:small subunit ribosomal protein S6